MSIIVACCHYVSLSVGFSDVSSSILASLSPLFLHLCICFSSSSFSPSPQKNEKRLSSLSPSFSSPNAGNHLTLVCWQKLDHSLHVIYQWFTCMYQANVMAFTSVWIMMMEINGGGDVPESQCRVENTFIFYLCVCLHRICRTSNHLLFHVQTTVWYIQTDQKDPHVSFLLVKNWLYLLIYVAIQVGSTFLSDSARKPKCFNYSISHCQVCQFSQTALSVEY